MWNTYIFINSSELIVILEIDIKSYQYLEFFGVATNFDITQDLVPLPFLIGTFPSLKIYPRICYGKGMRSLFRVEVGPELQWMLRMT